MFVGVSHVLWLAGGLLYLRWCAQRMASSPDQKFAGYFLDVVGGVFMIIGGEPAVTSIAHGEFDAAFTVYASVFLFGVVLALIGFFWSKIQPILWPDFSLLWIYRKYGALHPMASLILVVGIGATIGGVITGVGWHILSKLEAASRANTKAVEAPKKSGPEQEFFPLPLTMRNLFDTDFPQYLSVGSDITIGHADQTQKHTFPMRLFVNFDDQSEFLAFFIPRQTEKDETFQLSAAAILNHKAAIESVKKSVQVWGRMPGDTSKTDSQNLTFTGRIYVYYEDDLSLGELAALDQLSKQHGVAPQFRGHDYRVLHWNEKRVMQKTTTTTIPPKSN